MSKAFSPLIFFPAHVHGTQPYPFFPAVYFPAIRIQNHLDGIKILCAVAVRPPKLRLFYYDFCGRILINSLCPVGCGDFRLITHMLAASAENPSSGYVHQLRDTVGNPCRLFRHLQLQRHPADGAVSESGYRPVTVGFRHSLMLL